MNELKNQPPSQVPEQEGQTEPGKKTKRRGKRHLIRPAWLRIPLKVLMWIIVAVLLIPMLLYLPPVQTWVKDIACNIVHSSTGMDIKVDKLRIRFPLDVELQGVSVVEATGDTMASAASAVANLKLLPLLHLDVQVKALDLTDGYYRMVSPDSSMTLGVRARSITIDPGSAVDIASSKIDLTGARIRGGNLSLLMDVWRQKPTPKDTTSTPFLIKAKTLDLEDFTFSMSMLPTIDTLVLAAPRLNLKDGVIDLRTNDIHASLLTMTQGNVRYLTPTAEYLATHPAPEPDSTAEPSAPMTIRADSIALDSCRVLYAVSGAKPMPGFDASYIQLEGVGVGLRNFYNQSSTVRLPLTRLKGKERCGLQITRGTGTVLVDSTGLTLDSLRVSTPYSRIAATAALPFSLMAMQPEAPLNVDADASVGMPDVDAFMPSLSEYTSKLPGRNPLSLLLNATGTLGDADINTLQAKLPGVFVLDASGKARNALDVKQLEGAIDFDASLQDPRVAESLIGQLGFEIPRLTLKGHATARQETYAADFDLILPEGTVAGTGKVGVNSEAYAADIAVNHIDVGRFAPGNGLGELTARVNARGQGFDPEKNGAKTEINLDLASLQYKGETLRDITAAVTLLDGLFTIDANSGNPGAQLSLQGQGTVAPDLYTFDLRASIADLDLMKLGLSETPFEAHGDLTLNGTASPARWLYDARLGIDSLCVQLPEDRLLTLPGGMTAELRSTADSVSLTADATQVHLDFESRSGLQMLLDRVGKVAGLAAKQIDDRDLQVDSLRRMLPEMKLRANVGGYGALAGLLDPTGLGLDTLSLRLSTDSLITADARCLGLHTKGLLLDTLTFGLKERGGLLDYKLHLGNRPGNLDEFADVNLSGYLGSNRVSVFATQHNTKGEMGYRLGLTAAAMADTTVSVHFTPLKATIGYMPWTFNPDNHLDYDFKTMRLDADLSASSLESSIAVKTVPSPQGGDVLTLKLDNIHVEDFLQLSVFAPPMTATLNSNIDLYYNGHGFEGTGNLDVTDFTYGRTAVGDLDLTLDALYDNNGATEAQVGLRVDNRQALTAHAVVRADSTGTMSPDSMWLALDHFPLKVINPFLPPDLMKLSGALDGRLDVAGKLSAPQLNGSLGADSVGVYVDMIGTTLHLDRQPLTVADNVVTFDDFDIWGVNKNPLTIAGTVDASRLDNIKLDLSADADNFQLVGNDRRAGSQIYGKLFLNLAAKIRGPLNLLDIKADADVLGTTDVTYVLDMNPAVLNGGMGDVVKFVNFADTMQTSAADSISPTVAMRIDAALRLTPGMEATVMLGTDGQVQVAPSGTLNYFQNYMGDMRLNGQLNTGEGLVNYKVPALGKKEFNISPTSFVNWTGDLMNPTLNLYATDAMKVNVQETGGNTSLVNFLIGISATGTLSAPKVVFDLSTDNNMAIENELASMSPDQRATQAMNLLLYGQYTGPGVSTKGGNIANMALNSFLTSAINNWAADNIRGVDLSFGVDQYNTSRDGRDGSATSYSYQVSKSLFNNRFKINVGGNYTTDASADENFSENLVSDISFEYMLRQTNNVSMYVSLFRHNGYESILEGEVTETGAAFVLRRRINNLKQLFNFLHRNRNRHAVGGAIEVPADTAAKSQPMPAKRPEDEEK